MRASLPYDNAGPDDQLERAVDVINQIIRELNSFNYGRADEWHATRYELARWQDRRADAQVSYAMCLVQYGAPKR